MKRKKIYLWLMMCGMIFTGLFTPLETIKHDDTNNYVAVAAPRKKQERQYVDSYGNGTIKGSRNYIYHLPGSRYYKRTTKPIRMFKTISEATRAGFRAPKQ